MINLILGRTGSGKSYEAVVYHIIHAIENGRKVVTNLPLNEEVFSKFFPQSSVLLSVLRESKDNPIRFYNEDDYMDDWRHPENNQGCLFVIDECHKSIPSGGTRKEVEHFYAEHRHQGHDILLITQSYRKLSRNVVDLVDIIYRLVKARQAGSDKSYVRKVQDGVRGEVISTSVRRYKKHYFQFYSSHDVGSVEEAGASDFKSIWSNWIFKAILLFFLIFAYRIFSSGVPFFNELGGNKKGVAQSPADLPDSSMTKSQSIREYTYDNYVEDKGYADDAEPVDDEELDHPLRGYQISEAGFYSVGTDRTIKYAISYNGVFHFTLSNHDLISAGYLVERLSKCISKLEFPKTGYKSYSICANPRPTLTLSKFGE